MISMILRKILPLTAIYLHETSARINLMERFIMHKGFAPLQPARASLFDVPGISKFNLSHKTDKMCCHPVPRLIPGEMLTDWE